MFQEGDGIPHGSETQAHDAATSSGVHQLVNLSRLETAGHVDVAVLWLQIRVLDPDERPRAAIHGRRGTVGQIPHRQSSLGFLRVCRRVRQMLPVGQEEHLGGLIALELAHDFAREGTLGADGLRRVEPDEAGRGRARRPASRPRPRYSPAA